MLTIGTDNYDDNLPLHTHKDILFKCTFTFYFIYFSAFIAKCFEYQNAFFFIKVIFQHDAFTFT